MKPVDWVVVGIYGVILLAVGIFQKRKAEGGLDDYFVSGRKLRWWVAGTSMIAASFASDTPLLVTSLVRESGIWGNWVWWGFGFSTLLTVFFFSRLWRRSEVLTEAELTELRYSGDIAAVLRGFKAIFWGLLYNCFQAGAWAITGLAAVTTVMTNLGRTEAILVCAILGGAYSIVSGLWGVVATDLLQFVMAIGGAILLAAFAVHGAGGMESMMAKIPADKTTFLPLEGPGLLYCLTYLLVQWWAWKNTDGGGVLVQRMAACRNEREAVYATLWYSVMHYAVRCWPWVIVGLASLVVMPNVDHQSAYPLMIRDYLPTGLRGLIVAWFLAEFMSSIAGSMNWGGSLLVNDFYRRFVRKDASPGHYLTAGRIAAVLVMAGAVGTAFLTGDIVKSFGYVLKGTAAVGIVFAARWLWWRVNAWSEITAMVASPAMTFVVVPMLPWKLNTMTELLVVIGGSLVPVLLATFLTKADDDATLEKFYRKVRPPGPGWRRIAKRCPDVEPSMNLRRIFVLWALGCASVYGLMIGIGSVVLLRPLGWIAVAAGLAFLGCTIKVLRRWENPA